MTQHSGILTLTQWLSPAFPVGAFSYSHGLEQAIEARQVDSAETLEAWLHDLVTIGSGRSDAVLLCAAYRADGDPALRAVSDLSLALSPSRERRAETAGQGAAFNRTTSAVWGKTAGDSSYPVVLGQAARHHDIDLATTVTLYLHAFVSNLTAAAQRLMPLGQTGAQAIVARLGPVCAQVSQDVLAGSLDDIGGCTFASDIASMRHETQHTRLFQS